MPAGAVAVRPIEGADAAEVAEFLHRHLNSRVSAADWLRLLEPPWGTVGPNRGFQLRVGDGDGELVGAYAAVYSERRFGDAIVPICNLAAFCVLEPHRLHSLRLIRPLLAQRGYAFTDFSPSGNVVAMNERLGFHRLDTSTRLVVNLPGRARSGTRVTADPVRLQATLAGRDAEIYRDHRTAAAAHHILVTNGNRYGYVIFRRDRRKRLPLFASPLYAGGDRELIADAWSGIRGHLLSRGFAFSLAERRVLGFAHGPGRELGSPRAKMYRGDGIDPATLDYLYSELALVSW